MPVFLGDEHCERVSIILVQQSKPAVSGLIDDATAAGFAELKYGQGARDRSGNAGQVGIIR